MTVGRLVSRANLFGPVCRDELRPGSEQFVMFDCFGIQTGSHVIESLVKWFCFLFYL